MENINHNIMPVEQTQEKHFAKKHIDMSALLLNSIIESSVDIIFFALDSHYCYLEFNSKHKDTMQQIWGEHIEIGMNMLQIIHFEQDRIKAKANFDKALAGESFELEEEYGDEKLSRLYWRNYYSPMRSAEGEVIGLTCIVLNISKQRRAEVQLNELIIENQNRNKFLITLINSIPDAICYKDCDGAYQL
jgi:PAS domain-containing protein